MGAKTFSPAKAAYTKEEIADEVNYLLDDEDGYEPLEARDVTDAEAQEYVDLGHKWLQDAVGMHEDDALDAETAWMESWTHAVRTRMLADALGEGGKS